MRIPLLALLLLSLVAACGGGGGTNPNGLFALLETEPNNGPGTANALPRTDAGAGDLALAGDTDFWSFSGAAGEVVQIELFGTRLDQASWDIECNSPQLTLFASDGATKLLEHDFGGGWGYGRHDLDIPLVRIPSSGTYYLCVAQQEGADPGAAYAVKVTSVSLPGLQFETEPAGATGGNDGPVTAQAMNPGDLYGHHVDNESDWYKFTTSAASVVCFSVTSHRNGIAGGDGDYFRPELRIFGTDGATQLASADDVFFDDPEACIRLDTPGTYYAQVREASGSGDAPYFLRYILSPINGAPAETEPNTTAGAADAIGYGGVVNGQLNSSDTDFFAFTGAVGDMVFLEIATEDPSVSLTIELRGPDGATVLPSNRDSYSAIHTARTILREGGTHYIRLTTSSASTIDYSLSLARRFSAREETESNDDPATPDEFDAGGRAAGAILPAGDRDLFRFGADEGQLVVFDIYAKSADSPGSDGFFAYSGHGSSLEPRLRILRNDGVVLATSLYSPSNDCVTTEGVVDGLPTMAVAFIAPSNNTYFLEVTSQEGTGAATHYYVVQKR